MTKHSVNRWLYTGFAQDGQVAIFMVLYKLANSRKGEYR